MQITAKPPFTYLWVSASSILFIRSSLSFVVFYFTLMQVPIFKDSWTTSIFFLQSSATQFLIFALGITLLLSTYQQQRFFRHNLPRSCLAVCQFLLPEFLEQWFFFFGSWIEPALTNNLPDHRKAEVAAQPTVSFNCYCPCWTAVYSERQCQTVLFWSSRGQTPCTYWFFLLRSFERWQILQILYCSLPPQESCLLSQCPVHKRRKKTLQRVQITDIHSFNNHLNHWEGAAVCFYDLSISLYSISEKGEGENLKILKISGKRNMLVSA